MIRYSLKCANGHAFESWFQSGDAFDKLAGSGMLACTVCGSSEVEKTMMTPQVRPSRVASQEKDLPAPSSQKTPSKPSAPRPDLSAPGSALEEAVAEMRRQVESKADYVGMEFASEARAIHDGDSPERAIYGEARPEEAKKLLEDGVPVAPLPFIPNRKTN